MQIKKIQEADVENKKVLLRIDFNVSLENGHAKESFKIKAARESLNYLLDKNAKIALVSYFGRPEGKVDPELSMEQLVEDVQNILGVKVNFVSDCIGDKVGEGLNALANGEVLMPENVRFYPGEDANDEELAKRMAENFDVFINDSFSQSHRDQASITGITKFIPSYAGFRLQKEIEEMEKVKNNFSRPAVAIIGGAKIETKLPVIKFFEEKYDFVLVGGKIANEAIDQKMEFSEKVILPVDYIDDRLDIEPKTIEKFKEIISGAKTIVWNGPLGKFEEKKYAKGSNEILEAVISSKAYTLVGGGETLEILEKNDAMDKISFVSTGGGAMLAYLSGNKMPGIEVLEA
jgi:phosphoglycerate kinase